MFDSVVSLIEENLLPKCHTKPFILGPSKHQVIIPLWGLLKTDMNGTEMSIYSVAMIVNTGLSIYDSLNFGYENAVHT